MADCPSCRQPVEDATLRFCPHCGQALAGAALPPPLLPPPLPPPLPPGSPLPPPPPSAGPAGERPARSIPWEERDAIGLGPALVETTRWIFTDAAGFFAAMPVTGGVGSPLLYAFLVGMVGVVANAVYSAILRGIGVFPIDGELSRMKPLLAGVGFVSEVVGGAAGIVIGTFVGAAIIHLVLLLFGNARRDYEATFRVICFAYAAQLLMLVPMCGVLLALPIVIYLEIVGLSEAHGISRGAAAAAVLLPLLLVCCCCGIGFGMMFGAIAAAMGGGVH